MNESPNAKAVNQEIAEFLRSDPRIKELCVASTLPYLLAALADWGLIAACVYASLHLASLWVYPLACLLIAGRQHAFFALSHEAAHYRISGSKLWNDVFSNCLFAYPVLFDTDAYRQNHLKHHGYLNSEADPDWVRKIQLPQWQFPLSLAYVARTYPKFLLWNGPREWFLIMMMLGGVLPIRDITKPDRRKKVAVRALYYGAVATGITAFSAWGLFLAYWVVPLVFVFPSLQRVRSVAEHFGLERTHDLNSTRNVMAPWFERMLFGPHNIHYHLDHHLISSVPFYHLPRLHEILRENPTFRSLAHENTTYLLPSAKALALDLFTQFSWEKQNGPGDPESAEEKRAA